MANPPQQPPAYGVQPAYGMGQPSYGTNQPVMMNQYQPGYQQPPAYGQQGPIIIAS